MLNLLSIGIGIVFVLLLFSLLATTIMEMLAGLLSLSGKNLINAITTMLGNNATNVFTSHPYFRQLGEKANLMRFLRRKNLPPSYIQPSTFTGILMDLLQLNNTSDAQSAIAQLPDGDLKEVLNYLYRESFNDIVIFRMKVQEWFDEVMERASEWYVNNVRIWLIWIGFFIAVFFNVDVINIYQNLSANAVLQEYLADAAAQFVESQPAPVSADSAVVNPDLFAAREHMEILLDDHIAAIRSPLGLGWDNVQWPAKEGKTQWWIYKLAGWLTTAFCVSLGAKFWFDLLRQLVGFRKDTTHPQHAAVIPSPKPTPTAILTQPGLGLFESTRHGETEPENPEAAEDEPQG